jgi:hypothetical protein
MQLLKNIMFWMLLIFIGLNVSNMSVISAAEKDEITRAKNDLVALLEKYAGDTEQERSYDTSRVEQGIIKLMKLKAGNALLETMKNAPIKGFDSTFVWAICDVGDPKTLEPLISYIKNMEQQQQIGSCRYLGKFTSDKASKLIKECLASLTEKDNTIYTKILSGALLASGDKETLERIKNDIKGNDIDKKVSAIQLIGYSYNPLYLEHLIPLFNDKTALNSPITSNEFPIVGTNTGIKNGRIEMPTNKPRELTTIIDVALESANILFRENIPSHAKFGYGKLVEPAFGFDDKAIKNISDSASSDKTARSLKLKTTLEAVNKSIYDNNVPEGRKCSNLRVVLLSGQEIKGIKTIAPKSKYWLVEFTYDKYDNKGNKTAIQRKTILNASTLDIIDTKEE